MVHYMEEQMRLSPLQPQRSGAEIPNFRAKHLFRPLVRAQCQQSAVSAAEPTVVPGDRRTLTRRSIPIDASVSQPICHKGLDAPATPPR